MADNFANYYYIKVKARATIGGKTVEISSFDINYTLDEIPTARIELPIGRQMRGAALGSVSKAMGFITTLTPFEPITISMEAQATPASRAAPPGKDQGFPKGMFPVFKGYIGGAEYLKDGMGAVASLAVTAFGEPAALAGSTQYSKGTDVAGGATNGGDYIVSRLGSGGARPNFVDVLNQKFKDVGRSLWTLGIEPLMQEVIGSVAQWTNDTNTFARVALKRINTGAFSDVPKLDLSDKVANKEALNKALVFQLSKIFYEYWKGPNSSGDLWDVLKACMEIYGFHFIPGVENDAIVPLSPNIGGKVWNTIDPSEYYVIQPVQSFDPKMYSYLTRVCIFMTSFQSGQWQASSPPSRIIGAFPQMGHAQTLGLTTESKGRTQMVPAPLWLYPPGAIALDALDTGGVPDKGNPRVIKPPKNDQGKIETEFFKGQGINIGDRLAETLLHEGLFAHRRMTVGGRFRMDIAPGSLIKVNSAGERFTSKMDTLFGCVNSVRLKVGNQGHGGHAGTELTFSHVRTQAEHDKFTAKIHPLFGGAFKGGPLIKY